jgi:di/tricarboxylate transporter
LPPELPKKLMDNSQIFLLFVLLALIISLILEKLRPANTFLIGVFLLVVGGIIPSTVFIHSLANTSILSIFLLIIITAGINKHFRIGTYLDTLFGNGDNSSMFLFKMGGFVTALSSIMNNTPVVAMLMPYVHDWSRKRGISPSKFLMPLSYFAIVGGMITVIGTSTNLVLQGLVSENTGLELAWADFFLPGLIVAVLTLLFVSFFGYRLLPNNKDLLVLFSENTREYLVETVIPASSPLIGQSIENAGLRNLNGVYLAEIIRANGRLIAPVKPNEILRDGDLLFFAGDTSEVISLMSEVRGLELSKKEKLELGDEFEMVEAVVPFNSLLSGTTVKEFGFRERYDAVIVGIHRRGEKISGKIGNIRLEAGDLLLISAGPDFRTLVDQDKNLYIVSSLESPSQIKPIKKTLFVLGTLLSIFLAILPATLFGIDRSGGLLKLYETLFLILGLQFSLGMMDSEGVKKNVSLELLIILASALTFGSALVVSGTANVIANQFIEMSNGFGPLSIGLGLFILTLILTSFVTNVAAVSISFPIALALSDQLQISPMPFFMITAFGASACFLTPMGYQTNLMVYGPGGYRFKDFLRAGFPLTIIYGVAVIAFFGWKYQLNW